MSTELVEYQNQKPTFGWVRDGIQGNYDVVWKMIDIIRSSVVKDKGVETEIKQAVALKGLNSYSDSKDIIETVYDLVNSQVTYLKDEAGKTESIKDARTTLEDHWGDCDDYAIVNATLLADLGYEPKIVIGKYPETQSFQHVYCVVYVDGVRYVLDQTLPDATFNKEVQGMQTQEFGVFDERPETDGLQGLFRNFKSLAIQTLSNAKREIPMLSSFAGLGFIGNHALRNVLGTVASDPQSLNELGSVLSGQITDVIIQLQNGRIQQPQNIEKWEKCGQRQQKDAGRTSAAAAQSAERDRSVHSV